MSIHYLQYNEIDKKAWDNCILNSFNSCIYACAWYLDVVCERWDALIEDDYLSVMPLYVKHFLKYEIITMPPFAFELGIFSKNPINSSKTLSFIEAIPARFRYFKIVLNKYNPLENNTHTTHYKRFELDLIKPYHKLAVDFNPELRRKLNLAMAQDHSLIKGISPNDLISFILLSGIKSDPALSGENFKVLHSLVNGLNNNHAGEVYGILGPQKKLISAALFIWMGTRIHLIFNTSIPGQTEEAFLFLIDRFIEKYSETNSTLNFECQSASNSCRSFLNYAAHESSLPAILRNNLPFLTKLISPF